MNHSKTTRRVALVTGASSGIGEATALQLIAAGFTVYGTSRRGAAGAHRAFPLLALDVTNDASVQAAIAELVRREGRIDLLVNNAGIGITGAAEESSIEQVRALFETNFHGVVRVTNAVLPLMRKQRSGRILNVGSGLGLIPSPFSAYYSATKHALEGYSESLDHEVRGFGIRIAVIEPGATRTSFESSTAAADQPLPAYDTLRANYLAAYERAMAEADTPESVAETIVKAALNTSPLLRYPSGKSARQAAFARRFLPRSLFDKSLHKMFGMA
ncbi:oxidoreductase [Hylemonella gracilis]|uniref:Short chain dehydrogenase n=1 Tax=Hylemonella gracilis ATCC 19624 TaxID=887062 RepID=F3KXC8_9BURK|nr:oxidoreductase [Hylemonella gracilis]EGI75495.1 short chain dehydrogenase [Hylemonella gracilis ATCC 19624]